MTLIYEYENKRWTIEELAQKFRDIWDYSVIDDYKVFHGSSLGDIIIEASENFEEVLLMEKNIEIEYIENDNEPFDLNILLTAIV